MRWSNAYRQLRNVDKVLHTLRRISFDGIGAVRTGRTGRISAAGRRRIAAAQRARWAKLKGKKVVSITVRKRTMSSSARRRIAAAQKRRWAAFRKKNAA